MTQNSPEALYAAGQAGAIQVHPVGILVGKLVSKNCRVIRKPSLKKFLDIRIYKGIKRLQLTCS